MRIADPSEANDPLAATAMAIEAPGGEQAVLVSLDLVATYDLGLRLREYLAAQPADHRLEGFDLDRLIMFATHTHTAPYLSNKQGIPSGVMNGDEYRAYLWPKLSDLIAQAWHGRASASLATAQATAPVGFNRIVVYRDGSAAMYGDTTRPDFLKMEGPVDHTVELIYTWDAEGKFSGVLINVASPSQVVESRKRLSADFWHEVRTQLRQHPAVPDNLFVLAMCGAAGDQSPRDLENRELTREDTHGTAGMQRIGRLLTEAVTGALPAAESRRTHTPVLDFAVRSFDLPRKEGRGDDPFPVVLHALRIGDAVVVDNPFELYTAYGLEIKKRSAASQTFIAQLASGPAYGMYLPTAEALPGGAYGSRLKNGQVGPEGGRILVDQTIELIDSLFE